MRCWALCGQGTSSTPLLFLTCCTPIAVPGCPKARALPRGTGRTALPKAVAASEQDQRWKAFVSARRCDSKSRGSIYDSVAGARPGKLNKAPLPD